MIAAIWAQDDDGIIGKNDQLPWHLPNDLKFFKHMTENNTIVMGRKTFEGMGKRVLSNRKTIVLTSDKKYQAEKVLVMHSVSEVLEYAQNYEGMTFITGGSRVYEEFLPYVDVLYRTLIHSSFKGDAFFPKINWQEWSRIGLSIGEVDEKNPYTYQFETFQKKDNSNSISSELIDSEN